MILKPITINLYYEVSEVNFGFGISSVPVNTTFLSSVWNCERRITVIFTFGGWKTCKNISNHFLHKITITHDSLFVFMDYVCNDLIFFLFSFFLAFDQWVFSHVFSFLKLDSQASWSLFLCFKSFPSHTLYYFVLFCILTSFLFK